eukprot:COSAG03_NODE_9944_length_683_cov_0.880137_1_plen_116_part_10
MIGTGTLLSTHAILSQCLLLSIVLGGLVLQLQNKPYAESDLEAKRWSSLNMHAAVSEACKLVSHTQIPSRSFRCANQMIPALALHIQATIALGLLSTATNPGDSALGHAISAGTFY